MLSGPVLLTIVCVSYVARGIVGAGLRDNPIEGPEIAYLDGNDWIATRQLPGPVTSGCKYTENIDYNHGEEKEGFGQANNQSECCSLCAQRPGCAAGVLYQGRCWFKDQADLSKPTHAAGSVACQPNRTPGKEITLPAATVPGDLITDLETAGLIGDPWFEMNFKNASLWAYGVWNYTKAINFTQEDAKNVAGYDSTGSDVLLVFDGIKMGARIFLNDHLLGEATDQFLRYNFSLGEAMRESGLRMAVGNSNTLVVSFDNDIVTNGRFMACTGGWDWAPYSTSFVPGYSTFSRGIWKSVYLVTVDAGSAAIEHVVPQIFYTGDYPTSPLEPQQHADFKVDVVVKFYVPRASEGVLSVSGEWGASAQQHVSLAAGSEVSVTVRLTAAAKNISLWWPSGLGKQPLYMVTVSYTPSSGKDASVQATRQVGFRYIALVTGNDTDPEYVKKASTSQTTATFGMLFRVNGAAIFSRGANMIPMEELEGRSNAEAFSRLVQSAVDGRMNMLRVWGGGIFLPDVFYDECDRLGIMLYHDMMYAQGHLPAEDATNEAELRHQVRRLSHHPCVAAWDGCNECRVKIGTRTGIYATFVLKVVVEEDASRPVWPSCPAEGWMSGVHALDSLPTGGALVTTSNRYVIETHGPYLIGSGFVTTNSGPTLEVFDSGIARSFRKVETGVDQPNVFASEFGCSVFSSFESMAPSLAEDHWGVHAGMPPENCTKTVCTGSNPMSERNHPCDAVMYVYFHANTSLDAVGEAAFKKQLYQCLIGQALNMKVVIEARRATNQFGIIVWQYNEIWPTGGWGSIEYGTPRPGQVIGGRWKPLHYFYRQSIFTDVAVACGGDGLCYVKNDVARPFSGTLDIKAVAFASGQITELHTESLALPAGPGVTHWVQVDLSKVNGQEQVVVGTITSAGKEVMCENVIPLTEPVNMKLMKANVKVTVGQKNADGSVDIHLEADHVAMYVTVTTLAAGRFSSNAILLLPPGQTIQFLPFAEVDMSLLQSSIRVEDVSAYME